MDTVGGIAAGSCALMLVLEKTHAAEELHDYCGDESPCTDLSLRVSRCTCMLSFLIAGYFFRIQTQTQGLSMETYSECFLSASPLPSAAFEKTEWACRPFEVFLWWFKKQGCLSLSDCQSPAKSSLSLWACHPHAWLCCCSNESGNFKGTHGCHPPVARLSLLSFPLAHPSLFFFFTSPALSSPLIFSCPRYVEEASSKSPPPF